MKYTFVLLFSLPFLFACGNDQARQADTTSEGAHSDTLRQAEAVPDSARAIDSANGALNMPDSAARYRRNMSIPAPPATEPATERGSDAGAVAGFVDIYQVAPTIRLDIRYATTNNFTGSKIYDCAQCYLRPETAQALARAQVQLQRQGLSLKLFDCYRPRPYQQRLWDKVPNPDYVAPPAKGSMHSRGAAVDLTIVDAQGKELDMGTPYDFFGREAHTDYTQLPDSVLKNRQLLRRVMEEAGLKGIRTEWWHFSYQKKLYPLSDWVWDCGE